LGSMKDTKVHGWDQHITIAEKDKIHSPRDLKSKRFVFEWAA